MSNSFHTSKGAMLFWTTAIRMTKLIADFMYLYIAIPEAKINLFFIRYYLTKQIVILNAIFCSSGTIILFMPRLIFIVANSKIALRY
jgi:hypothetical protein